MLFRIVIVCLVLTAAYAVYQIVSVRSSFSAYHTPEAAFTVKNEGNYSSPAIVEFLNYDCGFCKETHLVLLEYAEKNPDVRYVARPVPYSSGNAETAAEMALAAGLQDKFWEMDRALAEYHGELDEKFYRETAALYDIDYDEMVKDADSGKVMKFGKDNAAASIKAELQSTPAFMIGETIYELDKPLTMGDLIRMVQQEKNK